MLRHRRTTFFCFSPPVMIATFLIELSLMVYTLLRYRWNTLTRLSVGMLFCLALFQLAEFQVCEGTSGLANWSHLGFVAITLLPPLGLHAIYTIVGKKSRPVLLSGYLTSAAFVAYFALSSQSLNGHECLGNYVIFHVNANMTVYYGIYYWGWVILSMLLSAWLARSVKNKLRKQALYGFAAGYAVFLIPVTVANLVNNTTVRGIPSIMCGFAVLFAFILSLYVLPRVMKKRS